MHYQNMSHSCNVRVYLHEVKLKIHTKTIFDFRQSS